MTPPPTMAEARAALMFCIDGLAASNNRVRDRFKWRADLAAALDTLVAAAQQAAIDDFIAYLEHEHQMFLRPLAGHYRSRVTK